MATYEITDPPNARVCDTQPCGQIATVRVIIPHEITGTSDPGTLDNCCLCWDLLRSRLITSGHVIMDTTGDVEELRARFQGVNIFRSDEGVIYASVNDTTYDAYLASQLSAQLEQAAVHVTA